MGTGLWVQLSSEIQVRGCLLRPFHLLTTYGGLAGHPARLKGKAHKAFFTIMGRAGPMHVLPGVSPPPPVSPE